MEFLIRTIATAALVALVLRAGHRLGPRAAGLLAGLPLTTAPALGWAAATGGPGLAAQVAVGTVEGCILVPVFAVAYGWSSRRCAPAASALTGLAAVAGAVGLLGRIPASLAVGVLLGAVTALLALQTLGVARGAARVDTAFRRTPASAVMDVALVGLLSGAIAALATVTAPQFAGLLAGVPTLGLLTIARLHGTQGNACVAPFLRGYILSNLCRVPFGAVFALTAVPARTTAAMLGALVAGAAFCMGVGCAGVDQLMTREGIRPLD